MPVGGLRFPGEGTCPQCKTEGVKIWTCKQTQQGYCSNSSCQKKAGVPSRINPPKRVKREHGTEHAATAASAASAFRGAVDEQDELRAELSSLDQLLLQLQTRRARVKQLLERGCADAAHASSAAVLGTASATATAAVPSNESPEEHEESDKFAAAAAAYSAPRLPANAHGELVAQIEALIRPTGTMSQVSAPAFAGPWHPRARSRVRRFAVCVTGAAAVEGRGARP
jgi:hypothetical protein